MLLSVFGATGRTGRLVVDQALAKGHAVTAYLRESATLATAIPLTLVRGDLEDTGAVERAVRGADAVVSALGPRRGTPAGFLSHAARTVTAAMRAGGVRRLVWLTGAGVMDADDEPSASRTVMRALMRLVAPELLRDSEECCRIIRESGLEWTVVRVPMLSDGPPAGPPRAGSRPPRPRPLARADVAAFLLAEAEISRYPRRSPMLSR